jgi:predicted nucleic-acid-binding protein
VIGLDTNILVRFVTRDDEKQWKRVDAFLKKSCSSEDPAWISCIVLCEVVWVLSSGYEYAKADIVNLLKQLILTAEVKLEAHDAVRVALKEFEKGKADLSDYLIGHLNKQRGCETTITFDKKAAKSASFSLI